MKAMTQALLRHRKATVAVFIVLLLISAGLSLLVQVNYDLAQYLPEHSMTKRAIQEMEAGFGYDGMAQVMVEDVTVAQALDIKAQIEAVDHVKSVLWLDDLADMAQPLEAIGAETVEQYYKDGAALFQVTLGGGNYDVASGDALNAIRALGIDGLRIGGQAEESRNMRELVSTEMLRIFLVVVPLCLLVLFLATDSWIEPPLYLAVLLVAIGINMGTNAFFPSVSFITHSMSAVLQLAISLDYSVFLFHRYLEERDAGKEAGEAVVSATVKSFSSIVSSALTTIAGFLALVLMQYTIGRDIGLVLAKGITISLITVMTLMPVLIYMLRGVIDKTRHKHWVPSFGKLGRAMVKVRWPLIILLIIVTVPAYIAQGQNTFLYGDTSGSAQGDTAADRQAIEARFGADNPVVLLVPSGDTAREVALADALEQVPGVRGVQALVTLADPAIPRELLPEAVVSQFESERYSRMVVNLAISGENDEVRAAVAGIQTAAQALYPDTWMAAGTATSLDDIRQSVEHDGTRVQLLSMAMVALVVLFAFRSISIPVLLVLLIQSAIWINMSVPYFTGTPLVYIGYLIISSIQLGATIDYAILLTNRYTDERRLLPPREAAVAALTAAGPSILVSMLILSIAGFAEAGLSQVGAISAIGMLLGRGALLSGLMVILCLPPLLALTDRFIWAGTLKRKGDTIK